jgi:ribonuclease Z
MLFDCGEGTYGQLIRAYNDINVVHELISNLDVVFISHMHADHHLGFITIINVYIQQQNMKPLDERQKLIVIAPTSFQNWINEYQQIGLSSHTHDDNDEFNDDDESVDDLSSYFTFISCSSIVERMHCYSSLFYDRVGVSCLHTVRVPHCYDSFGIIIEHTNAMYIDANSCLSPSSLNRSVSSSSVPFSYKVVYSGDTIPCQALIDAGADATILIHESTFTPDMLNEAVEKHHSTTIHAIGVGMNMRAKRTILTHFSQRYPKMPTTKQSTSTKTQTAVSSSSTSSQSSDPLSLPRNRSAPNLSSLLIPSSPTNASSSL